MIARGVGADRIDTSRRYGRFATSYQPQHQSSHAAAKQAIVQAAISKAQFAIVFTQELDEATFARIRKQGIAAYSLSRFVGMLAMQLDVQASIAKRANVVLNIVDP